MSDRPATVADLIEALSRLPQDAMVVLSMDREGNGFSPIEREPGRGLSTGRYDAESTWSGWFYNDPDPDEEIGDIGPSDDAVQAVCLCARLARSTSSTGSSATSSATWLMGSGRRWQIG